MRPIEFRGYSKKLEKWIYGFYVCDEEGCWEKGMEGKAYIMSKNNGILYEVEKESVGQFVGICDLNEKRLYEGDIVNPTEDVMKVFKLDPIGVIEYNGGHFFMNNSYLSYADVHNIADIHYVFRGEIVGNAYEHPELFKRIRKYF